MKPKAISFLCLLLLSVLSSFKSEPDAFSYFESGLKHLQKKEFFNAITDFTMAVSLKPDFGKAYLERARAKILYAESIGHPNNEFCFDLIQALNYKELEAAELLALSCSGDCLVGTQHIPDSEIVFCLDLSSKILHALPVGCEDYSNIIKLNLFNNKFTSFPSELASFRYLLSLDISSNRLLSVDSGISQLTNLRLLNLNKNELVALPGDIQHLSFLRELHLKSNKLTRLPEGLGKCQMLEIIDLSYNQLKEFPADYEKLKNLKTLILTGNPIEKKVLKEIKARFPRTSVYF